MKEDPSSVVSSKANGLTEQMYLRCFGEKHKKK